MPEPGKQYRGTACSVKAQLNARVSLAILLYIAIASSYIETRAFW